MCILFFGLADCIACSMCKVTVNGNTYVGNNEDSWRMGSRIWFERSKPGKLGCVFVGYDGHPQGGMNEAGLAFDGLAVYPKPIRNDPRKKEVSNATAFLKEIMQSCRTVEDVKQFAIQYNRQKFFNHGEHMFVDKAGNYVVMEPDTIISGKNNKYVLTNFCPSITSEEDKFKNWDRYKRGKIFLDNHVNDTNPNLAFALTDTMHECRERIGGGTMYSYVADLNKGDFTLFFYHDFKHPITFNLQQELAKGDHELKMASIFPPNEEYLTFVNTETPRNNTSMLLFLFLGGGLFAFSFIFFLVSLFWKGSKGKNKIQGINVRSLLVVVSAIMVYYMTVLYKDEGIFFASAPFKNFQFSLQDITAYIPFLLLISMIPLLKMSVQALKGSFWGLISKSLFTINILFYVAFIALFFYWGLYNIS
jgi:hypothetical protein